MEGLNTALALPADWQGRAQAFAVLLPPTVRAPQAQRAAMRQAVHQSMVRHFALALPCDAPQLAVRSTPGQAPVLLKEGQALPALSLSIAYAQNHALWAWSAQGAVGVDVQAIPTEGDDAEWRQLATQYLEPGAASALAALQGDALRAAFAAQWVQLEAQLKCAGMALDETVHRAVHWNAGMQCLPLPLPASWGAAAALAWRAG